jgi:hypothetical protein
MHSLLRAKEIGLTVKEVLDAWYKSSRYTLPKTQEAWKFSVYGLSSLEDIYFYDHESNLLFTCSEKPEFTVVITVTKREG